MKTIPELLAAQRTYFQSGATIPLAFRRQMLDRLYTLI